MTETITTSNTSLAPYSERFRPQFHLSATEGWLGDPDGLFRYQGSWHVFWWGHAESPDLVHWTERPAPMQGDDGSFVYFTGSVVVDEANTSGFGKDGNPPMVAIYTMHDRETEHETQGLSISHDGTSYHFHEGNPVLDAEEAAFRDPQVFRDPVSDRWLMVITLPDERAIRIYDSKDLKTWRPLSETGPWGARSTVWEVPDLIEMPVDGDPENRKWVMLCGMSPNRNQYAIGNFDGTCFTLDPEANAYLVHGQGIPGRVLIDFENRLPLSWEVTGCPAIVHRDELIDPEGRPGHLGMAAFTTWDPISGGPVEVESESFVIDEPALNFLVAGGGSGRTSIQLIVDGAPVHVELGAGDDIFRWVGWDVSDLIGQIGTIRIIDREPGSQDGALTLDHIMLSPHLMQGNLEHANWLDAGPDYYAVRTWRDYDHRDDRIIAMGWMGNWEYAREVPTSWGKGYFAVPRELSLQSWEGGLRLCQQPIAELAALRGEAVEVTNLTVPGDTPIPGFAPKANQYELDLTFSQFEPGCTFGVRLAIGETGAIDVGYDQRTGNLFLDRTRPGGDSFSEHFAKYVSTPLMIDDTLRLRILVDRASVEVFANRGEATISAAMFPDDDSTGLALFAIDGVATVTAGSAWELASIWPAISDREVSVEQ